MKERTDSNKNYFLFRKKNLTIATNWGSIPNLVFEKDFDFSFEKLFAKKNVNYQFLYSNQQWFAICAPR